MGKAVFKDFLYTKGLKLTKERDEILNEILLTRGHFDPEKLYIQLKNKGSKVSRASVYRTIPLLIQSGILEQVERIERHAHYEKISDNHHDHMICTKCGKVIEFHSPDLETLQEELCLKEKFKSIRHSLEIFGYCDKCNN